jgi:hypothetical protein
MTSPRPLAPAATRRALAVVILAAALTILAQFMIAAAGAQAVTTIVIDAGGSSPCVSIDEDDEIVVSIRIENVQDLQAWEATVVHDDDILEIIDQQANIFIGSEANSSVIANAEPLPDINGRHLLGAADASDSSESGDGVLGTLTFRAISEGVTTIDIPQTDLNNDGRTDEGGWVEQYGGIQIDDHNFDGFFDGPVQAALVAVGSSCAQATTAEPTDPPTAAPNPSGSEDGSPGTSPGDGGPGASNGSGGGTADPSGQSGSPGAASGSPLTSGEADPSRTGGPAISNGDGGDGASFPVWAVVALLVGGLGAGGLVVAFAVRRASGAL